MPAGLEDQRNEVMNRTRSPLFPGLRRADLLAGNERRGERAEESPETIRRQAEVGSGTTPDAGVDLVRVRHDFALARPDLEDLSGRTS